MSLAKQYEQRAATFQQEAERLESKYLRFSFIRLAVFVAIVGIAIFLFSTSGWLATLFTVCALVGFGIFVNWHLRIKAAQIHHENLSKVNLHELAACRNDHSNFAPGTHYTDPAHPFALDLDIFGPHSFFQFSNRTSTTIGSNKLASYFLDGADTPEIEQRQAAIRELGPKLEWRQHLQAYGMSTEDQLSHLQALDRWLEEPPFISDKKWVTLAMFLAPIWFVATLYLTYANEWPWQMGLLSIVPQILVLRKFILQVNETHQQTAQAEKILAYYAKLIQHIEEETFSTEKLKNLQNLLRVENGTASSSVKKLSYIIGQLNVRMNAFAFILNALGLWDLYWVQRLEKWKAPHKYKLPRWFECLEEFEALHSLATVHYNRPDWCFPEVQDQPHLEARELGHPLLPLEEVVSNDFQMPTAAHTKLITGSNMAGKSTFLRTVGLNIVLAMAGAPVAAQSLRLPLIQVYTSMRTQDALHESTSSFYAELKRLKVIIEAVDSGKAQHPDQRQPFFLLDEILKGTNSKDRHTGSKALIHQLIQSKGSGLIATHDLELGAMEAQYGGAIENLCMEVEVENDELVFDYKLKKGVSKSFNATHLMRNMGIRI